MPVQNLDKQTFDIISNMEPSTLVQNVSHQQLMQDSGGNSDSDRKNHVGLRDVTLKEWTTVGILCFVNLINYMDRFTVAGILTDIKTHFDIRDDAAGLLQTVFIISYMVFAPLFGYLGDRYNRKFIMAFGVFLWSLTTLLGSFMNHYVGFIIFRALVGIGEASYSTIAPTIISDLFVKDLRSIMLAFFYFAIPVGSGLGYIIGSKTAALAGSWQWGLRVTPILGAIAVLLIIFVMIEPVRGQAEGHTHLQTSSWFKDIKLLSKNRSFMFSTLGFTCVAFVTGALAWWGPIFMLYGIQLQEGKENTQIDDVSLVFGVITMCSGIIGVPLGSFLGSVLKKRFPRADALICAAGLFVSAPLILAGMFLIETNTVVCLVLIFFAELSLNLNWAIVADMLLYVVIPTRRSTAEAIQILISHAFGDAGSPYLIGVISEALKIGFLTSHSQSVTDFKALQYALFSTCFVEVLGGIFFLLTAIYIVKDKNAADKETADNQMQPSHIYAEDTNSDSDQQRNLVS